jgi:hypothetical protein
MLKTGDIIYFSESTSGRHRQYTKPLVSQATIGKVGRKFAKFSSFDNRVEGWLLDKFRYNIADSTIEYYWGSNEWRELADRVFADRAEAAATLEQKLLSGYVLSKRNDSKVRELPLSTLRSLESCLDLDDSALKNLNELRSMQQGAN